MRAAWAVAGALIVALVGVLGVRYFGKGNQNEWGRWVTEADRALCPKPRSVWTQYPTAPIARSTYRTVELNTADSLALVGVYGIGPVFAGRILAYRAALGGFYRIEQLREVRGITEEVFLRVEKNFRVDEARIEKININFVAPTALAAHPYVTPNMARRLVEGKLKGGYYNKVEDLLNRDILLPGEAKRLAPYLLFAQAE